MTAVLDAPVMSAGRRHDRRARLQRSTYVEEGERFRTCGSAMCAFPAVVKHAAGTSWQGVETCSSVWACPVCSARVRRRRQESAAVAAAIGLESMPEGRSVMVTLTMSHHKGERLVETLDSMFKAWAKMTSGRNARRLQSLAGGAELHWMRATEVTHGQNGWHPHFHVVMLTTAETEVVRDLVVDLWANSLERMGRTCNDHGVDVREGSPDDTVSYALKAQMHEAVRMDTKTGGKGAMPFDLVDNGLIREWNEYLVATKGRRAVTYSKAWRSIDDAAALSDAEVEAMAEAEVEVVAHVTSADCNRIRRNPALSWAVLDAAEYGFDAVCAVLMAAGIVPMTPGAVRQMTSRSVPINP